MIDEALLAGADRFDVSMRLWQYSLLQAMSKNDDMAQIQYVHLKVGGQKGTNLQANNVEIHVVQVSHSHGLCPWETY